MMDRREALLLAERQSVGIAIPAVHGHPEIGARLPSPPPSPPTPKYAYGNPPS